MVCCNANISFNRTRLEQNITTTYARINANFDILLEPYDGKNESILDRQFNNDAHFLQFIQLKII
jgi:hypothetical protein